MNRHFFQRHTDDQQTREKMLNITNHEENANQNHNEIAPHTCQNGFYQKKTNNMLPRMYCWWECKLIQAPQKKFSNSTLR